MRREIDKSKLQEFMSRFAQAARGPGNVYFTGGATMVLLGIRDQTIDVDIKMDPEPKGAFEAIRSIKDELDINIELASAGDFIPPPPDWRAKSRFIEKIGEVSYFHYDFRTQALSKLERGLERDLTDVSALVKKRLVRKNDLLEALATSPVIKNPAIDPEVLKKKVDDFVESLHDECS